VSRSKNQSHVSVGSKQINKKTDGRTRPIALPSSLTLPATRSEGPATVQPHSVRRCGWTGTLSSRRTCISPSCVSSLFFSVAFLFARRRHLVAVSRFLNVSSHVTARAPHDVRDNCRQFVTVVVVGALSPTLDWRLVAFVRRHPMPASHPCKLAHLTSSEVG